MATSIFLEIKLIFTNHWLWFCLSVLEFIFILLLLLHISNLRRRKSFSERERDILKESKRKPINMGGVMQDIFESGKLYDELKKVCHPDRFVNTDKYEIADRLFQEITNNKSNSQMLLKLKEDAHKDLGINFSKNN